MVKDMYGVPIIPGKTVIIHQEEGKKMAVVIEANTDFPTKNQEGHWIDVTDGESGVEGIMSYIVEVKKH